MQFTDGKGCKQITLSDGVSAVLIGECKNGNVALMTFRNAGEATIEPLKEDGPRLLSEMCVIENNVLQTWLELTPEMIKALKVLLGFVENGRVFETQEDLVNAQKARVLEQFRQQKQGHKKPE